MLALGDRCPLGLGLGSSWLATGNHVVVKGCLERSWPCEASPAINNLAAFDSSAGASHLLCVSVASCRFITAERKNKRCEMTGRVFGDLLGGQEDDCRMEPARRKACTVCERRPCPPSAPLACRYCPLTAHCPEPTFPGTKKIVILLWQKCIGW